MIALKDKVVVITGASSGIGRAAALEFASRGAKVALAARRDDALEDAARSCREAGGEALVVPTDVTREEEVDALIEAVLSRWGAIDVFVNNAGVTLFGSLAEAPFAEHRRVIETNLFGAMSCARAVVPIFRRQRQGTLINVGSILSKVGQPIVPSYTISKFALRGLSETLRVELADDPGIHVCTLLPYAVDTPHFESGANEVGLSARPMQPVQAPEKVARALVALAARPRRELHVPRSAALGLALHALWPRTTERLLLRSLRRWHLGPRAERRKSGNLYRPAAEPAAVHGTRSPEVSAGGFFAWVTAALARIEAESVRRGAVGLSHRARRALGRQRSVSSPDATA